MFSLVTNIRRKFSKTNDDISDHGDSLEKTGFKRSLHMFKTKFLNTESSSLPVPHSDNIALSPRAIGFSECAHTDIEWPVLIDKNPNILDRFTRIVTINDYINNDRVRFVTAKRHV